ncbi:Trypsin [Metarhizium anisopliae]|nr:Trypsin [Metarhizium anisopliae]
MVRNIVITLAVLFSAVLSAAATLNKRIIGGEAVKDGEFPFIVTIIHSDYGPICGGSLLDNTTVLTAGHCITLTSKGWHVRAGTLNRTTSGQVIAAKPILYPRFSRPRRNGQPRHDIAILKLSTPFQESGTMYYPTLPDAGSDPVVNSHAIVAGWGLTGQPYNPLDPLKKANIPIHSRKRCSNQRWNATGIEDEFCAGGDGKDACNGDSGGPLIDEETGHIIGIPVVSSWLTECGEYPGIYTRVSSYIDWIQENLGVSQTTSSVKS